MTTKDHIKTILDMPFLEKERQVERVANIICHWFDCSDRDGKITAKAIIEAERKEVLSSLHISGVLNGALKALEDAECELSIITADYVEQKGRAEAAEARVKELETVDPDLTIAYMAGAHDWKKRAEKAEASARDWKLQATTFDAAAKSLRDECVRLSAALEDAEAELSIALEALREIAADQPSERPDETSTNYTPFPAGYDAALFDQGAIAARALVKITIRKDHAND